MQGAAGAGAGVRPVEGFPQHRVGADGSVWSNCGRAAGPGSGWYRLKPAPGKRGHLGVRLAAAGLTVTRSVARLVLGAFVGPCPDGCVASYADGDPGNVALTNLAWRPRSEVKARELVRGTRNRGTRNGRAKLTDAAVREIRAEYAGGGTTQAAIAVRRAVSPAAVSMVVRRQRWGHLA